MTHSIPRVRPEVSPAPPLRTTTGVFPDCDGVEREYFHGLYVDREVLALIESGERELEEAGARLVRVSIPPLDRALIIGLTLLQPEASDLHRSRLRSRADDYEPGTRLRLEFGRLIPAHHYASAVRARRWFQLALHDVFRERRLDALVAPTSPVAALPLEQSVGDYLGRTSARVDLSELGRHGSSQYRRTPRPHRAVRTDSAAAAGRPANHRATT